MTVLNTRELEIAAAVFCAFLLAGLAIWLVLRNRPTAAEIERARRLFLTQSGRILDGMLLDVCEVEAEDGRTLTMLLYSYHLAGVDYECSQDVTDLRDIVDPAQVRAGFLCSIRYQPGSPQNSIVVAEGWTGLRIGLPVPHAFENLDRADLSHLRPGRG